MPEKKMSTFYGFGGFSVCCSLDHVKKLKTVALFGKIILFSNNFKIYKHLNFIYKICKWSKKVLKKEALIFLMIALLIKKRSPPLIKAKKNVQ